MKINCYWAYAQWFHKHFHLIGLPELTYSEKKEQQLNSMRFIVPFRVSSEQEAFTPKANPRLSIWSVGRKNIVPWIAICNSEYAVIRKIKRVCTWNERMRLFLYAQYSLTRLFYFGFDFFLYADFQRLTASWRIGFFKYTAWIFTCFFVDGNYRDGIDWSEMEKQVDTYRWNKLKNWQSCCLCSNKHFAFEFN